MKKAKSEKLVRDKIPNIIKKNDGDPLTYIADEKEYWQKLKEKLIEEIKEFFKEESKEEFVDIIEVMNAIGNFKNFKKEEIERLRIKKALKKGTFKKRIILKKVIQTTTILK